MRRSFATSLLLLAVVLTPALSAEAQVPRAGEVIYFLDFEDGKLPTADTRYIGNVDIATDVALGTKSGHVKFADPPPAQRDQPPHDCVFNAGPIPWTREAYTRWYFYVDKAFDLPSKADGYWPAPACWGLKADEGFMTHFFTWGANGLGFSTYFAKCGPGFRVIVLTQENPPPDKNAWIAKLTPDFKERYTQEFPWAKDGEAFKGTEYYANPWNPDYRWVYGTAESERKPMFGREQWCCIEVHVKAASGPGAKDGVIEMWLDGKGVFSRRNLDNDRGTLANAVLRGPFHDHDYPPVGSNLYVDNLMVDAKSYIGPIGFRPDLKAKEGTAMPVKAGRK